MYGVSQSDNHQDFIARTDRKSLYTQLKRLVRQAKDVAEKELNQRRSALKQLLESEDKIYEEEFAHRVKSRMDEDIRERKNNLLKIQAENKKNELEFLKSKRIQQYMNSCYEIREALRDKETQDIQKCQLQQMLEKERALRREQDLEKYWLNVQDINLKVMDEHQKKEDCLKSALVEHVAKTRRIQLEELEEKREKERLEKLKEKSKIDALQEELRLEAFDQKMKRRPQKVAEYRSELLQMMKDKDDIERKEEEEKAEVHRKLMREIARLEAEEITVAKEEKKAFYKATMDFIRFVKGVRQLEEEKQQMFDSRIEELRRIDLCTKYNISREQERKARLAEQCFAALREQICEQYKLRLREEAEYHECKMLENRFARNELSREEILAKRQKNRKELEEQIEEIRKLREAEDAKFSNDLKRASNDPEYCAELAKKYIQEGIDYLEPHANWRILACPSKEYVAKPPARNLEELMRQGAIPRRSLEFCSCMPPAERKTDDDGRGDESMC